MFELLPRIPLYKTFRKFGYPKLLPLNLTVSVTSKCNSRCRTCNIWKSEKNDLTLEEFKRIFKNIGQPYWVTLSGGEPFLRKDLVEICLDLYETCRPKIVNIPTNGSVKDTAEIARNILKKCPEAQLVVNVSIDGIDEKHDEIRGVKGSFENAIKTYKELKKIRGKNFTLGIHTVISKFNVSRIPEIYEYLEKLNPDSYITEIAEKRVELGTMESDITPNPEDYEKTVDFLSEWIKNKKFGGLSRITEAFRLEYYEIVKKILLEGWQVIPCYAGFASAQISASGDVWFCCVKGQKLGNLRENGYDFRRLWFGEAANREREKIKRGECFCPLANASYTNMLLDCGTMLRVVRNLV